MKMIFAYKKYSWTVFFAMLICICAQPTLAKKKVTDNTAELENLWNLTKEAVRDENIDSVWRRTRRIIELAKDNRYDSIPYLAWSLRAELRMQDEETGIFVPEYHYFKYYPQDGPNAEASSLMFKRLQEFYREKERIYMADELPEGTFVSEIHERKKEIGNSKLQLGKRRHSDLPFLTFFLQPKDSSYYITIVSGCGFFVDLFEMAPDNNPLVLTSAQLVNKNSDGVYFCEWSMQKTKEAHTGTSNFLAETSAEVRSQAQALIATGGGNFEQNLAVNAVSGLISGLLSLGSSEASKSKVINRLLQLELTPKAPGVFGTRVNLITYTVDHNNQVAEEKEFWTFDSYFMQSDHEAVFYDSESFSLCTPGLTFSLLDSGNKDYQNFYALYSPFTYKTVTDKKGRVKPIDITKQNEQSLTNILYDYYTNMMVDNDPLRAKLPPATYFTSSTRQSRYGHYNIELFQYDEKAKKYNDFIIEKDEDKSISFIYFPKGQTEYKTVYDLETGKVIYTESKLSQVYKEEVLRESW